MAVNTDNTPLVLSGAFIPAVPVVGSLAATLNGASIPYEAVRDTVVATMQNVKANERFDIEPNDGRFVMSPDMTKIVVGRRFPRAGKFTLKITGYDNDMKTRTAFLDVTVDAKIDTGGGVTPPVPVDQYFDFFTSSVATTAFYASSVDPHGFYDQTGDKTWLTYGAWDGLTGTQRSRLKVYDHALKTYSSEITLWTSFIANDNHDVPTHVMDGAGHVYNWGGQHAGTQGLRCWSTTTPRDPASFVARADFGAGAVHSYPHPVYHAPSDKIALFTRGRVSGSPGSMPLQVALSTALGANGPTFAASRIIADFGNDSRFYQGKFAVSGPDVFIAGTRADLGDTFRQGVYIGRYRPSDERLRNLAGDAVISPTGTADRATLDASFLVVDQAARNVFGGIPGIEFDTAGRLHLVYGEGAGWNNVAPSAGSVMHMVRGTDGVWSAPTVVGAINNRYDSFAIARQGDGIQIAWVKSSLRPRNGTAVFRNRAADGTWTAEAVIKAENAMYSHKVAPVRNAKDDLVMLITENIVSPSSEDNTGGSTAFNALGGSLRAWASDKSGLIVPPKWQMHPRTQAALAQMQEQPNTRWAQIYDELVLSIINNGDRMDGFYPLIAHSQQAGLVNLVGTDVLTVIGSLTHETIPGRSVKTWKGAGGRLQSSIIPASTAGVKWASDRCHIGIFSFTDGAADTSEAGTIGASSVIAALRTRGVDGMALARISTSGSYKANVATGKGHMVARRTSSTVQAILRDGGGGADTNLAYGGPLIIDTTAAYSGVPNVGLCAFDGGSTSVPSLRQLGCFHFGGFLTDDRTGVTYQAIARYLTAIDAIDRVQ